MKTETPKIELRFIGQSEQTEKLYRLEEKRRKLMREIAVEYARLMEYSKDEFWTRTMPEVLLSTLDSYSSRMSTQVARRYLEIKAEL